MRPPAADLAMSGQIEVAFVPASQRTRSAEAAPEDDAIVVVGQRQRKRKRGSKHPKASQPSSDAPSDELLTNTAPMPAANPGSQEIVEKMAVKPFDYSGMPNMLDEGYAALQAEGQASGSRKKKQRKGKGEAPIQYGEFPAPPRAQNEVRSGNKARTFK